MVKGYFFVKHLHEERNQLWARELSLQAVDIISNKNIVDILSGMWFGANLQEQIWQCHGICKFCKFFG